MTTTTFKPFDILLQHHRYQNQPDYMVRAAVAANPVSALQNFRHLMTETEILKAVNADPSWAMYICPEYLTPTQIKEQVKKDPGYWYSTGRGEKIGELVGAKVWDEWYLELREGHSSPYYIGYAVQALKDQGRTPESVTKKDVEYWSRRASDHAEWAAGQGYKDYVSWGMRKLYYLFNPE